MGTLTRVRVELKYLIPPDRLPEVVARIPDSDCRSYRVATTYLDRPDRSLSRGALAAPFECTKIRLREYSDGSPFVWVEVKVRSWAWSRKYRLKIEKKEVAATLRGEPMDRLPALPCPCAACVRDVSEACHRLRESSGGRLVPVGTVRAMRRTFSVRDYPIRFSVDEQIEYYRPPDGLYENRGSLHDGPLGRPLRKERCAVLEMKEDGSVPGRYAEIVEEFRPADYSKFRTLLACLDPSAGNLLRPPPQH